MIGFPLLLISRGVMDSPWNGKSDTFRHTFKIPKRRKDRGVKHYLIRKGNILIIKILAVDFWRFAEEVTVPFFPPSFKEWRSKRYGFP